MMKKSTGNMYDFVDYTFNVVKGKCPHRCEYCYMNQFPQGELRFVEKELKTNLGSDNFIFVGSSCDMFADEIPDEWILKVLEYCSKFDNKYLFQSKNPFRFLLIHTINPLYFPLKIVLGTTIESNIIHKYMGNTPSPLERARMLSILKRKGYETMITIEPILDFDISELIELIKIANPSWINIGADSKNHGLPEPSKEKVLILIEELSKITKIRKKSNLSRIIGV